MLEKPNVDFLIRVKESRSAMREVAKLPTRMRRNFYRILRGIPFQSDRDGKTSVKGFPGFVYRVAA